MDGISRFSQKSIRFSPGKWQMSRRKLTSTGKCNTGACGSGRRSATPEG
nr:MAG TPA: hypothetical protein [Inoviridae sp.]